MERGEESQPGFGEEQRRRTACPNFPSFLFSYLPLPLPSPFLDLFTHGKGAAQVGMGGQGQKGYCSTSLMQHAGTVAWACLSSSLKKYNFLMQNPTATCKQSNGMYSTISTQPQCPLIHPSTGSKKLILSITFMHSHVESIFCPLFILGVTISSTMSISPLESSS